MRGILTGGQTSATDFFRRKTEAKLTERFQPIVKATTDKVGLAQQYNQYAGAAVQFNLIDEKQAFLEEVTGQLTNRESQRHDPGKSVAPRRFLDQLQHSAGQTGFMHGAAHRRQ